jgi:hypothetical protein
MMAISKISILSLILLFLVSLCSCTPASPEQQQCIDLDNDGYGVGVMCLGPDCDENDPNVHSNCLGDDGSTSSGTGDTGDTGDSGIEGEGDALSLIGDSILETPMTEVPDLEMDEVLIEGLFLLSSHAEFIDEPKNNRYEMHYVVYKMINVLYNTNDAYYSTIRVGLVPRDDNEWHFSVDTSVDQSIAASERDVYFDSKNYLKVNFPSSFEPVGVRNHCNLDSCLVSPTKQGKYYEFEISSATFSVGNDEELECNAYIGAGNSDLKSIISFGPLVEEISTDWSLVKCAYDSQVGFEYRGDLQNTSKFEEPILDRYITARMFSRLKLYVFYNDGLNGTSCPSEVNLSQSGISKIISNIRG